MLESKVKVKKETVQIYDILKSQGFSPAKIQELEDRRLIKQSINIIYSTLINFSAPITLKLSALLFLKRLFQSACPEVIAEAEKVMPILVETATAASTQPDEGSLYFVLNELRPVNEVELSKKYVRFSMEIIKQWAEYMIDIRQQTSMYITTFRQCQELKVPLPSYFLYFTMKDYIEFMMNWNNRKRKNQSFQDKIAIFHFLTNADQYNKNLHYYKNNLSENSYIIAYQTYSILINHSIPVASKLQVLQSMKDLYHEGNLIYSSKIQDMVVPYFEYFVDLLMKNLPIDRYFQIIEHRLGVDPIDSRKYVFTILQLIDQWNKYNQRNSLNPFSALSQKINRMGLLRNITTPLFQPQDINRYFQKISIGKHRQPQYIIPPPKKSPAQMQFFYQNKIKDYQKQIQNLMNQRQKFNRPEVMSYEKKEENPAFKNFLNRDNQSQNQNQNQNMNQSQSQNPAFKNYLNNNNQNQPQNQSMNQSQNPAFKNFLNKGQNPLENPVFIDFLNKSNNPSQNQNQNKNVNTNTSTSTNTNQNPNNYSNTNQSLPQNQSFNNYLNLNSNVMNHPNVVINDSPTSSKNIALKEKQIAQMIQKSKLFNNRQYNQNQNQFPPQTSSMYRIQSQKRITVNINQHQDYIDDVTKIHKLSDAVKYKQMKKSRSKVNFQRY